MKKILKIAERVAAAGFLLPMVSLAAQIQTAPTTVLNTTDKVAEFVCNIMLWMFWGLLVLSVAMFLVGGYQYATSGGSAEATTKARKTLLYAAIGVMVAIIAKGVPSLVGSFLGVTSGLGVCQ